MKNAEATENQKKKYVIVLSCVAIINCFILLYGLYKRNDCFTKNDTKSEEVEQKDSGTLLRDSGDQKEEFKREETLNSTEDQQGVETRNQKEVPNNEVIKKQPAVGSSVPTNRNPINSCEYWDAVIDRYSQSTAESVWAKRVMRCESGCREFAYNRSSGASGLFQFIVKWHPSMAGKVFIGEESIKYALYKYRAGGAGIWVCK